jgi:hypothetical protein
MSTTRMMYKQTGPMIRIRGVASWKGDWIRELEFDVSWRGVEPLD